MVVESAIQHQSLAIYREARTFQALSGLEVLDELMMRSNKLAKTDCSPCGDQRGDYDRALSNRAAEKGHALEIDGGYL